MVVTSLIGFVGAPFTVAAYAVEGGHSKLCTRMKRLCLEDQTLSTALLDKFADALAEYACFQVECGAQIIQIFESWAHVLSEDQWVAYAKVCLSIRILQSYTLILSLHVYVRILLRTSCSGTAVCEQSGGCC